MQQKHCIFHCQPHKWTNMFDQIWSMPNANLPPFSMPSLSRVHIPQADRRLLPSHRSIITSTAITALRETLLKHFVAYYRNPSWPGPSGSSFAVQLEMLGISECPKIAVSSSCCEQSRAAWYIWRLLIFFRVRCWPIWGELQDFKHVEYVELAFSSTADPMSSGNTALQTKPWHWRTIILVFRVDFLPTCLEYSWKFLSIGKIQWKDVV